MKNKRDGINLVLLFFFVSLNACNISNSKKDSIIIAHSHNDYENTRPLFGALDYNFGSIEADVYSIGDSLFVAHDFDKIKPGQTLRNLYLEPLRNQIENNRGSVYGNGEEIILFVDIKDDGLLTYRLLHAILEDYKADLSVFESGIKKRGSILVVVSGERPIEFMQNQVQRFAGFDGRIDNLDSDITPELMPVISDNWKKYFAWDGTGKMPEQEKILLKSFVEKAHEKGYLLRFWGTLNRTVEQRRAIWSELIDANVDIIGTDHLKELNEFVSVSNNK
ncbi:phosphatidylinositol-specific phospholipase C/glycerophosphodiester phosphodiesterase family protein [Sunxiuqinia sp. sy24]|uniref:phosphatidylinositol-specific phospholipase C/glycerophosphodiester phosphodiesterase family protein n=1 Tax=Sunxiuqinia sp. sy24 TaxID=3461495 RepID=UPI004045D679